MCAGRGCVRINWVVVVKAQELQQIQKLKFKRNVSITLIFKGTWWSLWVYERLRRWRG